MPNDRNDERFQNHLNEMVKFAKMCGASETRAKDDMLKVIEFQQSLANIVDSKFEMSIHLQLLELRLFEVILFVTLVVISL